MYDMYTQSCDEVHKINQYTIVNSGKYNENSPNCLQYKELKILISDNY